MEFSFPGSVDHAPITDGAIPGFAVCFLLAACSLRKRLSICARELDGSFGAGGDAGPTRAACICVGGEGSLATMRPEFQFHQGGHCGELFVRHASNLEHTIRADGGAVTFTLATAWIDHRLEHAGIGLAVRPGHGFGVLHMAPALPTPPGWEVDGRHDVSSPKAGLSAPCGPPDNARSHHSPAIRRSS